MDAFILSWATLLLGILALLVSVGPYLLKGLGVQEVFAADVVSPWDISDGTEAAEEGVDDELAAAMASDEVAVIGEEEEDARAQLQIELPPGVDEDQITFRNDYLTRTVYVRFEKGEENYFAKYRVQGRSEHILFMSYVVDGAEGVMVMGLDRVYELEYFCEDGKLYMNFLDPHELYDKVVVVDAGHGGSASGATQKGTQEKDINLAIVLELKKILDTDERIGVYYTRTTDVNPTLQQRVELANAAGADLFISIHNNASATRNYSRKRGTLVLYSESDQAELSSRRLAQICADTVSTVLGSNNRGLLEGDNIHIIRNSEVPVALVEVGYMTQNEELELLKSAEYQHRAAEGVYQAMLRAFEEGY